MKYTLNLDDNNYILSIGNTENDDVELDLKELELDYLNAYQFINGNLTLDENKKKEIISKRQNVSNLEEIEELKKQLNDTDYIIIKSMEYQLNGMEIPYDIVKIHNERQNSRDKINELSNPILLEK